MASSQIPITPWYDLHCHLLPDWDDGPKNVEESLKMARRAADVGMKGIVATPHVGYGNRWAGRSSRTIGAAVEELNRVFQEHNVGLEAGPGAELLLGSVELTGMAEVPKHYTLNHTGKYALVESPFATWPEFGNNLLRELRVRGTTPIIAHPERYSDVIENIGALEQAVSQGALLQVTAGLLLGQGGKKVQACCRKLLQEGWVQFVASDAHEGRGTLPHEAVAVVVELVGPDRARQIFEQNGAAVWRGEPLPRQHPVLAPEPAKPKFRLFGR